MNIEIKEINNCQVMKLNGNIIGGPDATEFNNSIKQLITENKKQLIVDLGNISYVNSTGLGIIFRGYKTLMDAKGEFKMASLNQKMKSLLSITKLDTIFDVYDSVEEAINGFDNQSIKCLDTNFSFKKSRILNVFGFLCGLH